MASRVKEAPVKDDGFRAVRRGYLPQWDFDANPTLQGMVMGKSEVQIKQRGDNKMAQLITVDSGGQQYNLWLSADLRNLWTDVNVGDEVKVTRGDAVKLDNGFSYRQYECYVRPATD
jgi:hypothetical protein